MSRQSMVHWWREWSGLPFLALRTPWAIWKGVCIELCLNVHSVLLGCWSYGWLSLFSLYFLAFDFFFNCIRLVFSSVQFSHSVVSNSLQPHELQPGLPVHHQLPESTTTHVLESVMPSSHLIYKVHPSLLTLRNRKQHSGTALGDHMDPKNRQKAQTWEKHDIPQTKKRTLFMRWDKKAECRLGREQAHWVTQTFGSSMHVCEWLQQCDKQLIWRLRINLNQ